MTPEEMKSMQAYAAAAFGAPEADTVIVTIPAMDNHGDYTVNSVTVRLAVNCPVCGATRTGFRKALSYDGSRRMEADTWVNGCGHHAFYSGAREEAQASGLNPGYTGQAGYDVRKAEAASKVDTPVIKKGDYVRIVEDVDTGYDNSMTYVRDIQAVGVVRDYFSDLTGSYVEFPSGVFGLMDSELYLVDTDALHDEMEAMMTEVAWESAWNKYEAEPTRENAVDFIIANLRMTVVEVEAELDAQSRLYESVVKTYEARLAEHKAALDAAQVRVNELEKKLARAKPYVAAVDSIHRTLCDVPDGYEYSRTERVIFDMAEDTLLGIAASANDADESV